jgi:hypothetical protein
MAIATAIDEYRRALQRAYVERMELLMTDPPADEPGNGEGPDVSRTDIRPLVRAQLTELRDEAASTARRMQDRVSEAHLDDLVARIDRILEADGS